MEDWSQYLPKYATLEPHQQIQASHLQSVQQHNTHAEQGNQVHEDEEEEEEEVAEGEGTRRSGKTNFLGGNYFLNVYRLLFRIVHA